ncbi:MAG: hypothetical protein Q4A19_02310 [Johnsonella sp.]|nr:hypothetical protein [Johnsonella sp.]
MSMLPMKRNCPVCGREYSFNPSLGKIFCPYCRKAEEKMKAKKKRQRDEQSGD